MRSVFGIDLGTTNSVIARLEGGRPVALAGDHGAIVPSVVLYLDDRIVVGREALNLAAAHPTRTIRSAKRKMGSDHRYEIAGKQIAPEEAAAEVLRALRAVALQATGEHVEDAVITVPAYFDDAQRRATLRAGELAGLNVLRLLNEPTSAALVYEQVGSETVRDDAEIVLIYDLGGGTFDVSVLEVFEGVREVRSTAGNTSLGGDDFDALLQRFFLDHLTGAYGLDLREDPVAMAKLTRIAEATKIALSAATQVEIREEFLGGESGRAVHLDVTITRRQFEDLVAPLLESTLALTRRAIEDARLDSRPLDRVCLVGGSTRIPLVRRLIEDELGLDVHEEVDADLAVGLGAAIQAGILQGVTVDRILVDVAAHSLGIRVQGDMDASPYEVPDTFAPVLRRNTVLPAERSEEFYTMIDDQDYVEVEVFQGESARASRNSQIGSFRFDLQPAAANSPVRFVFAYDLNGVLRVSASQPGTQNAKTVALSVADATQAGVPHDEPPAAPAGAIERKAAILLEALDGAEHDDLAALLGEWRNAAGSARTEAEDALLDFFVEYEDRLADVPIPY